MTDRLHCSKARIWLLSSRTPKHRLIHSPFILIALPDIARRRASASRISVACLRPHHHLAANSPHLFLLDLCMGGIDFFATRRARVRAIIAFTLTLSWIGRPSHERLVVAPRRAVRLLRNTRRVSVVLFAIFLPSGRCPYRRLQTARRASKRSTAAPLPRPSSTPRWLAGFIRPLPSRLRPLDGPPCVEPCLEGVVVGKTLALGRGRFVASPGSSISPRRVRCMLCPPCNAFVPRIAFESRRVDIASDRP